MTILNLLPALLPLLPVAAADLTAQQVMEEVQRRSLSRTFRYDGRITVVKADGEKQEKSWRYERMGPPGNSKVMLRFSAPAEIRGVALLVWNHTGRPADIWLYTPALARHRRIAQQDRSTKFAGTDFSFEDLEEDDLSQWDYSDIQDADESGEACWRLTARRKTVRRSQYDKNWIWISKTRWTPLRMDKYRANQVVRRVHLRKLEQRQNIWTPMLVEIADLAEDSRTTLQLFSATYDARMPESSFTLEAMKKLVVAGRLIALVALCLPGAWAQDAAWQSRGFLENRSVFYPREAANDRSQWVNEWQLRWEGGLRLTPRWKLIGGLDAQTDTHNQVERSWHLSWWDRDLQRPAFAVRSLFAQYTQGPFRLEFGKQVLRWGVGDLFSPTDRLSARDLLSPSGADNLGVWAVRAVADTGPHSLELLYLPRFTPSRVPLVNQRWVVLPDSAAGFRLRFRGAQYPGGPQFGVRYHGVRSGVEYSASYLEGFQNLPSLPDRVLYLQKVWEYRAVYPRIRVMGGDLTTTWRGMVWKAEAAYSRTPTSLTDDFFSYVLQGERLREKWQIAAAYTGAHITQARFTSNITLDRAFAKSFSGRLGWTPKPRNTLTAEYFLQQNRRALIARFLFSRELPNSLRLTTGYIWITGASGEIIGRYAVNSYATIQLRYSF